LAVKKVLDKGLNTKAFTGKSDESRVFPHVFRKRLELIV